MSNRHNDTQEVQEQWARMFEQMNDAMSRSIEQNMEAQTSFMESWADAMEDAVPDEEIMTEGFEGYADAYEVWIDAAEQLFERTTDAAEGEDVSFTELRDVWLQSANEAFKQVMSTSAFAAANGQLVDAMMEMQTRTDEFSEDTLTQLGLPTRSDVDEVGGRLVELERRQHGVEEKLDRVLDRTEGLPEQLRNVEERQESVEQALQGVEEALEDVEASLEELPGRLEDLEERQQAMEGTLEDLSAEDGNGSEGESGNGNEGEEE